MTESLAPVGSDDALALLGGSGYEGEANYIPSAKYFTNVWAKSGEQAKDSAGAAGYKIDKDTVIFGYTNAGSFEFMRPFQFYLIDSLPCFNIKDEDGKSIRLVGQVPPGDPNTNKFKDGYVALLVARQGKTLVPMVATVGRFEGGLGKAIKTARLKVQDYAKSDLIDRGDQFRVAAGIAAKPFRCLFTLSASVEEGAKGKYLKGNVTARPATQDDVDIFEYNEVTDKASIFSKDFAECFKVYAAEKARIARGV
jgi:hypothetical protein